jgi:glutamate dehydrogenase
MDSIFNTGSCVLCKLNDDYGFLIKEVMLFRAISEYIDQIDLSVDFGIVTNLFAIHPNFSLALKDYFIAKFSPDIKEGREELIAKAEADIETSSVNGELSALAIAVFKSIERTNYFLDKESIAIKINLKPIHHLLRGLQPNYEIFVYHPEFMGLHLRMTRVSRGGLRWSERADFREEIKSLMITQDGKNSIIVPAGAKGGFYINRERDKITKEIFQDFYSKFIHNLLDMVDNRVGNKITNRSRVLKYDEDDTYFVVAADKGTAQMSDVANEIAISREFWLGDAFASGGSNGYSHKDLGITAKGAFVSTERFFIEKGFNFYETPISVVGIGSMNGDVFGNGIQLSEKFRLLGAFSHKEIFIDPNPSKDAHLERKRLFYSNNGSWSQYDKNLISKGGGVFSRKDEKILVTPEMKEIFGISEEIVSGEELIRYLLTAKVDLLFNGGVGTYVKSSKESNNAVGDYGNFNVRVDAKELKAFAVCEGGNLGFTQEGRVEYALNGGRINLDGIDNSAGVNISDHEVNMKILLTLFQNSEEEKRELLRDATTDIVNLVLESNYNQALAISLDETRNQRDELLSVIELLEEKLPQFKRKYFAISDNKDFEINRPNLSFLISYSKILLKMVLIKDKSEKNLLDSFFAKKYLLDYFPPKFKKSYDTVQQHPLSREIIGTVISDKVINTQGVTILNFLPELGEDEFRKLIERYLKLEQLANADEVRSRLGKSKENYSKLIEYEKRLLSYEESFREFEKSY